ncbi:hypothetical protein ADL03_00070 [Nocardia sp. NRRL S-836]|nr:hypothetical protein ADL03_00070 [Nocardia sp. NRRL S-836]
MGILLVADLQVDRVVQLLQPRRGVTSQRSPDVSYRVDRRIDLGDVPLDWCRDVVQGSPCRQPLGLRVVDRLDQRSWIDAGHDGVLEPRQFGFRVSEPPLRGITADLDHRFL